MSEIKGKINPLTYIFIGVIAASILVVYLLFQSKLQTSSVNLSSGNESKEQSEEVNRSNCLADDCLVVQDLDYPAGKLPTEVKTALEKAIDDEYKALSTYEKVIETFRQVRPFSMIKGAEQKHIASLKSIFDKYGLIVPENQWINKIETPATLQQACQIGVDAEIANVALYRDSLLPSVVGYEDIVVVFTNLMNASQQKHLPAFERCN